MCIIYKSKMHVLNYMNLITLLHTNTWKSWNFFQLKYEIICLITECSRSRLCGCTPVGTSAYSLQPAVTIIPCNFTQIIMQES